MTTKIAELTHCRQIVSAALNADKVDRRNKVCMLITAVKHINKLMVFGNWFQADSWRDISCA